MMPNQGSALLKVGRAAIAHALNLDFPCHVDESASWLQTWSASFVTLTQDQTLRGCIGSLEAYRPLVADVKSNAISAALHDPRFYRCVLTNLKLLRLRFQFYLPHRESLLGMKLMR